ncbi:MAG: glycosyltransferase [Verrucomicrobiota bacterium]
MKISIVVPAFNEEKLLGDTLRHIRRAGEAFRERGWDYELIVCDNNSTDRTAEIARAEGATVVFESVNQISRARNRGAEAAAGDWLLFIDADSRPTRELLGDLADHLATGKYLGGGATVTLDGDYFWPEMITRGWNLLSRMRRWAAGSFVFCETAAFRKLGGFSLELYASEEIELSERLKKEARARGKKMVILKRHPLVTSARKLHLYSLREHLRFLGKTILSTGRTLREREACPTWYDGRR